MRTASPGTMPAAQLLAAGGIVLGGPTALMACILAYGNPRSAPAAAPLAMPERQGNRVHGPVLSATHWNYMVTTHAADDAGAYLANHRIAHDPDIENEADRRFVAYPPGAVLSKRHFRDGRMELITRMRRTGGGSGPQADPWIYERIGADGRVEFSGRADVPLVRSACADCHGNAAQRDFVFHNHADPSEP